MAALNRRGGIGYIEGAPHPRLPAAVDLKGDGAINGHKLQRLRVAQATADGWYRRLPIGARRWAAGAAVLVVTMLAAGCGVLDGDDATEAPTTVGSPTVAASAASPPVVASPAATRVTSPASPSGGAATETEAVAETPSEATTESTTIAETPNEATTEPTTADAETATTVPATTTAGDDETAAPTRRPRRTPTPARPTRTPTPPPAAGCAPPAPLPEVAGSEVRLTTENINLRAGPGAECEVVRVLDQGDEVTVTSGPVDADDRLWVRVEAGGDEGWLADEFLGEAGASIDPEADGTEAP